MMGANPQHTTEPEAYDLPVRMLGTGAAAPTNEVGRGVAITRIALGQYRLTFQDPPGRYIGPKGYAFQGTVPANLKGCTITLGDFVAATSAAKASIDVFVWSSAFAARELAATERLHLPLQFAYGNS